MQSPDKRPHRRVYLLRCWEERGQTTAAREWRFSVEDPRTGERRGFTSLEALAAYLQKELAGGADDPSTGPAAEP